MKGTQENMNRTGESIHPESAAELAEVTSTTPPSSPGDGRLIAKVRNEYSADGELVGHVPPGREKEKTGKKAGRRALLMDKMGERLAFERSGTRLYEALLAKFDAPAPIGANKNAPSRADIEHICQEEYEHFELMREAIAELGGDPTSMTPAANVSATISCGLPKVLLDPRTTFGQCLDAVLVAELTDNDGWQLLVELARAEGLEDLADRFNEALESEEEHLQMVRGWIATAALAGGSPKVHA
jgi:hypothetical protein